MGVPQANELAAAAKVAPGNSADVVAAQAEPSGATLAPVLGATYQIFVK